MKGFIKFALAAAVLGAAGWFGWGYFREQGREIYVYRTQEVTVGPITTTVSATGKLSAVETVDVGTRTSGEITEIYVDFNSEVKKGQLLAVLDPDLLTSAVASSRASLTVARAGVATARANQKNAKRNHERNLELWGRQLIARSDVDSTETSLAVAEAQLSEALARVTQAEESLSQAETNLKYARITSPIDGVVVNKAVEVGQTVAASFNTPTLFSIAKDLTQMQIEANIDEADIGSIKAGQRARVTFDTWPDETFSAEVMQIRLAPETVSNVVTYKVILKIANDELRLLPGMTANINVITEQREDVVRIPAAALRFSPPAEVLAALDPSAASADTKVSQPGGLVALPRRRPGPGAGAGNTGAGQAVWLVEGGRITRRVEVTETGVSDRTWIEARGEAAKELSDGAQLAVAFTLEKSGAGVK